MTEVEVFSVVKPYNVMIGYQNFRGPCCLHLQGSILQQQCMASQPRRPQLEISLLWKSQNLQNLWLTCNCLSASLYKVGQ